MFSEPIRRRLVAAAPTPYALTGNGAKDTPEKALRVLGPVYNVGQARILLPPATP
jgi:hypothetical protein